MSEESIWTPCVFEYASQSGKIVGSPYEASLIEGASNLILSYLLPLPSKIGNRSLQLMGARVGISFADGSNRVLETHIRGIEDKGADVVWTEEMDITTPQRLERNFGPINVGNYHAVKLMVYFEGTTAHAVRVGYVSLLTSYR